MILDTISRKISRLENNKLKFAYRLMKVSGLRVSEVALLETQDLQFQENQLLVHVRHGKGGSNGVVTCLADPYLVSKLKNYVADKSADDRLFYSASYMKEKAMKLGIECHDLRRISAITYHNQLRREGKSVEEADELTKQFLRHERFSTTKRYLYNRKLKLKASNKEEKGEGNG